MRHTAEYLRRTRRSLRGIGPLVRTADRTEARTFVTLLAALALMVPLCLWVSAITWGDQLALAQQQRAERTTVTATLDADPMPDGAGWGEYAHVAPMKAPATWEWRGVEHHDVVQVGGSAGAGDELPVWVDRAGEQTVPPMSDFAAKFSSVLTGFALFVFAVVGVGGIFALVRWALDRARVREWSREIEAFLGSTSSH